MWQNLIYDAKQGVDGLARNKLTTFCKFGFKYFGQYSKYSHINVGSSYRRLEKVTYVGAVWFLLIIC